MEMRKKTWERKEIVTEIAVFSVDVVRGGE